MKNVILPLLMLLLLSVVMAFQVATPPTQLTEPPHVVLRSLKGFTDKPLEVAETEKNVLPKDTVVKKRLYTAPNGTWYLVSAVIGGKSKNSIHRPELCLPSHGYALRDPSTDEINGISWRRFRLEPSSGTGNLTFSYTFFNQDGYATSSHVLRIFRDVWDRSIYGRIDRWVMLTVLSSSPTKSADFLWRLKEECR